MSEENKPQAEETYSSFKADFPGVLDVSPTERLEEWLFQYYARIQTDTKPYFIISLVCGVFICFQAIAPALLNQAYIQKDTSVIASTIRFLSIVWIGGGTFGNAASEITSIVASAIILLILIIITFRAYVFSRYKSMKNGEISTIYVISTFILPILLSFSANSIGLSIDDLIRGGISSLKIGALVVSLITVLSQIYFHFKFISPRVMFIRDITLMWTPESSVLIPITTSVNAALYTASITNTGIPATVELIVMSIFSITIASYLFLDSMFINKTMGNMYSALLITNGTGTIINIVALYVKIEYTIIFFTVIVFVILSYLIFHYIWSRLSQISMTTLDSASQDEFFYGRSDNLARDVRRSLDFCSPGIFMFSLYDEFLEDDLKKCTAMLYVYIRIISAFPSYKYKLEEVNKQLKDSNISCRRPMNFQINLLMCHRNTAATSQIVKVFDKINGQSAIIGLNTRRFWESVLHGNTDSFWANIKTIDTLVFELNKDLNQNVNDFENCPEVVSLTIQLHCAQTFDFEEAKRLKGDLDLLQKGIPAHKDRALTNMMSLFPSIMNSISDLTKEIDIVGNALNQDNQVEDLSKLEVISDMINNAKVGKLSMKVLYLTLACIVSLIFYLLYIMMYKEKVTDNIYNTYSFLVESSTLLHSFARYVFTDYLHYAYSVTGSPFQATDDMMKQISPFWYEAGYIKKIDIGDELILEISNNIRNGLETISSLMANLDTDRKAISDFIYNFNNYLFPGGAQTISEAIVSIIITTDYDENYFNKTFTVYEKLKELLVAIGSSVTFSDAISSNINYLVISMLVTLFLYSFPMLLIFFELTVQMEEIAKCFSTLPSAEIRKRINNDNKEDPDDLSAITSASVNELRGPVFIGLSLSAFPAVILCYAFLYYVRGNVLNSDTYVRSGAFLKVAVSDIRIGFISAAFAFMNVYPGNNYSANKDLVDRFMDYKNTMTEAARISNGIQIVDNGFQLYKWITVEDQYRLLYPPLNESYNYIPIGKANFERLAGYPYMMLIDNFIFISKLLNHSQSVSQLNINTNAYMLWWLYDAVEKEYYETLTADTKDDLKAPDNVIPIFIALGVIMHIISLFYAIYQSTRYAHNIKVAMKMLISIDLEIIMSNQHLLTMIQTGRSYESERNSKVSYADQMYLEHSPNGIAIVDRNLEIVEFNNRFTEIMDNVHIIKDLNSDELTLWMFNVFDKKADVSFTCNLETKNQRGEDVHTFVHCIAMNDSRALLANEAAPVTQIAMIVNDVTKFKSAEAKIVAHHRAITEMLKLVIPNDILNDLQNGEESVSTTVHSVSVGVVQISLKGDLDATSKFHGYALIYKCFDEIMQQYSTLNKLSTFEGKYIFTGGLFMTINKPEKHAEESVRFAVDIIKLLGKIKEHVGVDFSVKIGLNTGGPVIAGVISIDFPSLTILGNVDKLSETMMKHCEENKIRVTRAVYELIFSIGLKVAENEPMKIGTEVVQSYTVDVK